MLMRNWSISDAQMLHYNNDDIKALKRLCQEHQKEMPTQIKLVYDVISDRINADYSYDIIFSDDQNKTAYDVLDEWYQLEKSNEK